MGWEARRPVLLTKRSVLDSAAMTDVSSDEAIILSDRSWSPRMRGKFLLYFGPHLRDPIPRDLAQRLLRSRKAYAAVYAYDWDNGIEGPQYSIICDLSPYNVEGIPSSNTRSKVRRGLKRCQVRRIEIEWLAENGYDVSRRSRERHGETIPQGDAEGFVRNAMKYSGREDVRVYGVFVDEELAAFGWTFDRADGIRMGPTVFDPAHSNSYPMYALFYMIAHERLNDGSCRFIDNGTRPMSHETNIADFLFSLGWRKAYTRLGLHCTAQFRLVVGAAEILEPIWRRVLPESQKKDIYTLVSLARMERQTKPRR